MYNRLECTITASNLISLMADVHIDIQNVEAWITIYTNNTIIPYWIIGGIVALVLHLIVTK